MSAMGRKQTFEAPVTHLGSTLRRRVVAAERSPPYLSLMPTVELKTDAALGVAIPSRKARGRIARERQDGRSSVVRFGRKTS
jgi:hypothetical protein